MNRNKLLVSVALLLFLSCKKEYGEAQQKNSPYSAVKATALNTLSNVTPIIASGKLASKKEIVLSFKIGGIVRSLSYEEGDHVKSGSTLAALDVVEIDAQVTAAQNSYDKAMRDLNRATNLFKDTVATLEQKQNAETAKEIAASQLQIVHFNRRYAQIKAPLAGKILKRFVEIGELVSPGQPIYKFGGAGTGNSQVVRIGLSDIDIVKLAIGDKAKVTFDAFKHNNYTAIVTEIAEVSDPKTGVYTVELSFIDYHQELKNGFIGKIKLLPSKTPKTYKIPMDALVEGNGKTAKIFYTGDLKTAQGKTVQVDQILKDHFTVPIDQIDSDHLIITAGAPYLRNNDSIRITQ